MKESERVFVFRCFQCGKITCVPATEKKGGTYRSTCKCKWLIEWNGENFQIIREDEDKKEKFGGAPITRYAFWGKKYSHSFYWSRWAIPLRAAMWFYVRWYEWKCSIFGWQPIREAEDQGPEPNMTYSRRPLGVYKVEQDKGWMDVFDSRWQRKLQENWRKREK